MEKKRKGKKKKVEEGAGKETMVEEKHPDVEKCTIDFVTFEKLEIDANESTQGM